MLSNEFLEKFFAHSSCLIAAIDREQRIVYSNLHGLDQATLRDLAQSRPQCFDFFHPGQGGPCATCHVREVFASGQNLMREKIHPQLGHLEIRCIPIRDESGEVSLVIEQLCDVSAQKRTEQNAARYRAMAKSKEQELQRQRDLARRSFDVAEVVMVVLDRQGRICQLNRKGCQLLGFEERELIGRDWFDHCLPQRERAAVRQRFAGILRGELPLGQKGENWVLTRTGRELLMCWSTAKLTDRQGRITHLISSGEDITDHRRAYQALEESEIRYQYLAHHDALTHLPNRLLFYDRMEHALDRARRNQSKVALFFLDLDRLKNINDSLGHVIGDRVLVEFARRLQQQIRQTDTLARLSGDEFVVLCEEIDSLKAAEGLADKILAAFANPLQIDEHAIYTPVSIGIALLDNEMKTSHDLLRAADMAMYQAKKSGGNRHTTYDSARNSRRREVFHMESHLRRAVELGETFLHYQPQVDLQTGRLVGVEALARWKHPRMGLISPEKFIAIAEETGQIVAFGDWVLETACAQNRAWQEAGLPPITVAVNISPCQLNQPDFAERVERILSQTGLDSRYLEIEITETAIMENVDQARQIMHGLCDRGINFALDDFGTGYSSLSNLRYLPLKKLKIDRSFMHDIPGNSQDVRLVSSVLALARSLDLQVVAEGIETSQQLRFMQQKGCEIGQGYYFNRPVAAEQLTGMMSRMFV